MECAQTSIRGIGLDVQELFDVINANGIGEAFVNTLVVTIPATILPITVAAFAAYAFAWMKFPGRDWLFAMVIGLMVVPLQVALIPILRLYTQTGIAGTFLGLWLAHTGFGLPLAIYLLYNYISQLPADLIESAKIDGASDFTAFMKIVLPFRHPRLPHLRSSSSSGFGMTCWFRWYSWAQIKF